MNKIIFILALCLATSALQAQWTNKYNLGINGGYEYNIYKTPFSLDGEDDFLLGDDLIVSGFYEGVSLGAQWQRNLENGRFKINLRGSANNFHTERNANLYDYGISTSYRTKYAKRKYFEVAPSIYRKQRAGIDLSEDILRTTLSYAQVVVPMSFDFYLGDKAWIKSDIGYKFKMYDKNDIGEQLYYHAFFAGANLSKKWENKTSIRKLIVRPGIEYRAYTDLEAERREDDEEEDELIDTEFVEDNRYWTYYTADLEYSMKPVSNHLSYTLGIYSTMRYDAENRFGYRELGPGINLNLSFKRANLSIGASYRYRSFDSVKVNDTRDQLIYQYLRANVNVSISVSKNTEWYIQGNLIRRISNNERNTSLAFRSYNYGLVESGITFKF